MIRRDSNNFERFVGLVACAVALGLLADQAHAQVLQAPIGGKAIPLGDGRVACATSAAGWSVDVTAHSVLPPREPEAVGTATRLAVAETADACKTSTLSVTLVATNRWPVFDPSSVVFSPDDARLEAKGQNLSGVGLAWRSASGSGVDVCHDDKADGGIEHCAWAVGTSAATTTSFSWLPAGARTGTDVVSFDADGQRLGPDVFSLTPARILLRRVVPVDASVDLATGRGEVPLVHPDAVVSADCGALSCEMVGDKLLVHGTSSFLVSLDLRLHLRPHVFLMVKEIADPQPSMTLPVTYCPMSVVSGPPIRSNERASVIVKLDGACANDVSSLAFRSEHSSLKVLRILPSGSAKYVWLRLGSVDADDVTITALRGDTRSTALAVARSPMRASPRVRAAVELPGFPNLDFIPNNRAALVHVSPLGEHEHLVLLTVDGVYTAGTDHGVATIQGDHNAAGLTDLHFGVRNDSLTDGLDQLDLAEVVDPLQRSIHEANIPAPIGVEAGAKKPLIEFLCGGGNVPTEHVAMGVTAHLPFSLRDTCRVVFHRERLSPEYGTQKLKFEIDITRPDGSARGDAHVSETFTFRAGTEPRYAFVRGVGDAFDRVRVQVSHEPDEAHYIGASDIRTGAPAAQWSVVLGTGHARLYGTTTIPTGLYRLSTHEYSGVLSLNFGVISHLTWLDADGHEGFLGLEGGVLVMGLANSSSATGNSLTQVGGVLGLGVSVPFANRSTPTEAALSLHVWAEADITRDHGASANGRYSLIFGPSISIGNIGTNL